jgi:GMP synthase-like glutamine amidotransferase
VRRGLIIENQATAPAGLLGGWLGERGIPAVVHRRWSAGLDVLPDPERCGFVVVLGAAESATRDEPDWIPRLRDYLGRCAEDDVPVLGICLGAQLLAQALGGTVAPLPTPEIFWGEVDAAGPEVPSGPWLTWHEDAFTVPPGATEVARSERSSLAFVQGRHLGIQFHAETTPAIVADWVRKDRHRFAGWGLDPQALQRAGERMHRRAAQAAGRLFAYWWRDLVRAAPAPAPSDAARSQSSAPPARPR